MWKDLVFWIGLTINSVMAGIGGIALASHFSKPTTMSATQEKITCVKADKNALTTQENGNDIEKSATSRTAKPSFFCFVPKNDA